MASLNITRSSYKLRMYKIFKVMLESDGHPHASCNACKLNQSEYAEELYYFLQHAEEVYSKGCLSFTVGQRLAEEDTNDGHLHNTWFQCLAEVFAYHITVSNYATFHFDFVGSRLVISLKRNKSIRESSKAINALIVGYILTLLKKRVPAQYRAERVVLTSNDDIAIPDGYCIKSITSGDTAFSINVPLEWALGGNVEERVIPEHSLETIRALCRNHLSEPNWSIESLSKECHLSVRALQRILIKYDTSFRKIMLEEKVNIAKSALIEGTSQSDIATQLGFSERSSFSRFFKKTTGMTPNRYRDLNV